MVPKLQGPCDVGPHPGTVPAGTYGRQAGRQACHEAGPGLTSMAWGGAPLPSVSLSSSGAVLQLPVVRPGQPGARGVSEGLRGQAAHGHQPHPPRYRPGPEAPTRHDRHAVIPHSPPFGLNYRIGITDWARRRGRRQAHGAAAVACGAGVASGARDPSRRPELPQRAAHRVPRLQRHRGLRAAPVGSSSEGGLPSTGFGLAC